jgi:hypothetical protein
MIVGKAEAYLSETLVRYSTLSWASGLASNGLEMPAMDKYSSLFGPFVS